MKVDMATYKSEFLSHYYSGRLRPRSAYAFGLIYWWARLGSRVPHLVNIAAHAPLLRTLARWIAGMPQERAVPLFAPRTFRRWFTLRPRPQAEGPRILLWPDTFNDHFHPEVAQAAVEVLETAGYQVTIPQSSVCCGRPLYDYGMLDAAKRRLTHLMRTLQHEIAQGIPIVILEPSCHAVFRDELLNLFPDDPTARRLSELTMQLSEAVEKAPRRQRLAKLTRRAVVHGHCHQKAVLKMDNDRALLESTGLQVEMLSSGCCGMAGSFGFEREHYDVSVKCGEQVLLPAVRNAPADALIVANGFSCREQIQQLTPRRALHLAQVLQMGLREGPLGPAGSHPESGYAPDPRARLRASYARVLGGLGVSLVAFAVVARVRRLVA
jgi:Fe-S oxidoreductase